ncbi:hypothetical protein A4G27_20415 [Mycobacterium kansasii]|nr:hypothetical protein A4G27_20415 [Mycobacterium kansasii]
MFWQPTACCAIRSSATTTTARLLAFGNTGRPLELRSDAMALPTSVRHCGRDLCAGIGEDGRLLQAAFDRR